MKKSTKKFLSQHILISDKEWNKLVKNCRYKYLGIDCNSNFCNKNFNDLLLFIGSHCYLADKVIIHNEESWEHNDKKRYINAYKVIRHEIRYYFAQGISSKELSAVRKSQKRVIQEGNTLKIPYKINYIFATIYDIIVAIKKEKISIPSYLIPCIGQIYRTAFYEIPYGAYTTELVTKRNIDMHSLDRQTLDLQLTNKFNDSPFMVEFN